jgi:hypothetical protein
VPRHQWEKKKKNMGVFKKIETPVIVGILFSKNVPKQQRKKKVWYRAL